MPNSTYNMIIYKVTSVKDELIVPAVFSILVFLLLVLFQPFEYRSYSFARIVGDSLLSAFLVLLATASTRIVFPYLFRYPLWTNQNVFIYEVKNALLDVLLFLMFSFLINMFFIGFATITYFDWITRSIKYVLIFETLLIPLSLFLKHYFRSDSTFSQENVFLLPHHDTAKLKLVSTSNQDCIEIFPCDLIMIRSWDNYIEVFYTKNDQVVSYLLRNTMYTVKTTLVKYPFIIQCHRSYMININKVKSFTGNSRGYQLRIEGIVDKIPVSRSRILEFKKIYAKSTT